MRHKPRLGSHLFLELDKANRNFLHEQNGAKSHVVSFETKESSGSFDAFRKPNRQKQCYAVHTKDLNQLGRDGHVDKVKCKPDMRSRMPKSEKIPPSRSFDDEINTDAFRDNGTASRGHHSARSVWKRNDAEHVSRAKLGPDRHTNKPVPKHAESKTVKVAGKKNPTFNADGITDHPEEGSESFLKSEKKKGFHARVSPSCSEAKKQRGSSYAQDTSDNEDTHLGSQSSPESERNTHGNHVLGTPRHINGTEGLQVRKSSRVPKKRIFDDDEEEPIRKQRKRIFDDEEETIRKQRKWLQAECTAGHSLNAGHDEEMDLAGDESEHPEKECDNQNESFGPCVDEKELPLTARQRALRLSKEGGELPNGNIVDFPYGLQPVLPRKQKEGISEAEQAIKKEEAAKRRKLQMEKNAKEIQASAIQKILGQESSRKKREEKLQKQREEIEQEKQAALMAPAVNSIRWVMGPSGNSVSFSRDLELPKIFSGPCSYPQEREKCAGPSCNNVYKYRDAKTRLPLCSLQCYRAVQDLPSAVC